MLLADTMAIFFVIGGLLIAFPSLWLLCRGIWGGSVNGCCAIASRSLVKSFFVGLPIFAATIAAIIALSKIPGPIGRLVPLFLLSFYLIFVNTGVAGLATLIGQRLPSNADASRPWCATLRGGIVLELPWLLPFVGWFVILPISLIIGTGLLTRALFAAGKRSSGEASPIASLPTNPAEEKDKLSV